MNTKEKKEEREKETVVSLVELSFLKNGLAIGMLLVMLVIATGSTSANGVCVGANYNFSCGMEVNESCTLNATMSCSDPGTPNKGYGLKVGADNIIIDGDGYALDGVAHGTCEYNEAPRRAGIYNYGHDNVTIKNLTVKNFCNGIHFKGSLNNYVDNCTIYNCTIHDNGGFSDEAKGTFGIFWYDHVRNSTIEECEIYNTTGVVKIPPCESGGTGIQLWKACNNNTIINNTIRNNKGAGILSKAWCTYNNITNNSFYKNGEEAYTGPTGGIVLRCYKTHYWNITNNNITDNYGPGIFMGGGWNTIKNNTVTGSKNRPSGDIKDGNGIEINRCGEGGEGGKNNTLENNTVCYNEGKDIFVVSAGYNNHGDENTCNTTSNYDDTGTKGCTYCCLKAAYRYQVNANPPTACNVPSTEFTGKPYLSGQYLNISADDSLNVSDKTSDNNYYATHRFNFSIDKDLATINNITVTWIGRGWHDTSGKHGANLSIYNFSSGTGYKLLNSTNLNTEVTFTRGLTNTTGNITDYINAGNITVLVDQKSPQTYNSRTGTYYRSYICTDYVQLEVKRS